nr:hypothetical protein [Tanacetum cinerariifolium]
TSTKVLLAKGRILKLIQALEEKQIESWSFPELLPQFLNDSRTIEQKANLAVQQEQEEQADDEEMLQYREKFMKDIQTFLEKFSRYPFGVMPKVLSIAWERFSEIKRAFTDDQYQSEEIKELMCKLLEDVRNILSTRLSECDVPIKDESSLVFTTFSNPIFEDNDDFTSSDDESFSSEEEVLMEDFKVYSNPLFDDDEINFDKLDPHYLNAESDFIESLSNRDTLFNSSLKFDYLEEFSGALFPTSIIDEECIRREHEEYISLMEKLFSINSFPRSLENFYTNTIIETLPTSPIPVEDSDSQREEIEIFTGTGDLLPPEPPDVEFLFDLEPNLGEVISAVMNDIDELNENECFNPGGEIDVFVNVEDDDYFPFIFVI